MAGASALMTELDRTGGRGELARGELVPLAPGSMPEWAERLVTRAREDGIALTGEGGLLTDLMRHVLQTGLEVEMAEHLDLEVEMAEHLGCELARRHRSGSATPVTAPTTRR